MDDDDKKTDRIHLGRKWLTDTAKAVAADEKEWENMPGVFSKPPDLGAGPLLSAEELEWSDKVAKYNKTEKRNRLISNAISIVGLWCMTFGLIADHLIVGWAGAVILVLVILFWLAESRRRRNLILNRPLPSHLQSNRIKN